jgi:hypothetical protein
MISDSDYSNCLWLSFSDAIRPDCRWRGLARTEDVTRKCRDLDARTVPLACLIVIRRNDVLFRISSVSESANISDHSAELARICSNLLESELARIV